MDFGGAGILAAEREVSVRSAGAREAFEIPSTLGDIFSVGMGFRSVTGD